jgi:hypothetical protein
MIKLGFALRKSLLTFFFFFFFAPWTTKSYKNAFISFSVLSFTSYFCMYQFEPAERIFVNLKFRIFTKIYHHIPVLVKIGHQ